MAPFVSLSLLQAKGELEELFTTKVRGVFDVLDAEIAETMNEFQAGVRGLTANVEALEAEVERLCADDGEGSEVELPSHFPQEGPGEIMGTVSLLDDDVLFVDSDFLKRFEVLPGAETAAKDVDELFCGDSLLMSSKHVFLMTLVKKFGCFVFHKEIKAEFGRAGIDVANSPYSVSLVFSNLYKFGRINRLSCDLERIYVLVGSKRKVAYRLVPKSL